MKTIAYIRKYRLFFITALLMLTFLAPGCDENNNMISMMDDIPPPGAEPPATCPCFTESDVKSVAEKTSSEFRLCAFNIAEIALAEGDEDFEAVCADCQYGTSGCFCKDPTSMTDELTEEEFNACAQILIKVLQEVSHMCSPADS